ncbi:MAG: NAD-dependent deacetylase [Spirochaetaceae bacterium]|jgi:NAD-dependent deacetylase|nr:NAD-dependent deacetylase [Spirochaetaceae bacterium]
MNDEIAKLFTKITSARHCVALTGAGVSTLSGIRDFRGKNGLYNDMDAQKIFDIDYFDKDPSFYYKAAGSFIYNIDEKEPSVVHTALAELERAGFLKALITQNIDLLHQKGGSRQVIEIHGSPQIHYCLRCAGVRMDFKDAAALVKAGKLPVCPSCGKVLKPAITFFGESLPIDALRSAESHAQSADLMLVLGTSLTVYPANGLPESTLRRGGQIVIVNNMETPLDHQAAMRFEDLGEVFEGLQRLLAAR